MLIQSITQRLRESSSLLASTATIDAEQAYTVASFFRDFVDTNAVINEAVSWRTAMTTMLNPLYPLSSNMRERTDTHSAQH